MAQDPNIFGKINFIAKYLEDPCDAPWTVYILPAFGATIEAFVSLYAVDWSDIFWAFFRKTVPIWRLRSGRKGRKGRKSFRGFDPNENLGKYLGQWWEFDGVKKSFGIAILWRAFGSLQRVLWWLLLVDIFVTFVYRFTSLVYESKYCQRQRDAVLLATNSNYPLPAIFPETGLLCSIIQKQRGPITKVGAVISIPPGWQGVVTAGCGWYPLLGRQNQAVRLRISKKGHIGYVATFTGRTTNGSGGQIGLNVEVTDGGVYTIMIKCDRGFAQITEPVVYAHCSTQ